METGNSVGIERNDNRSEHMDDRTAEYGDTNSIRLIEVSSLMTLTGSNVNSRR